MFVRFRWFLGSALLTAASLLGLGLANGKVNLDELGLPAFESTPKSAGPAPAADRLEEIQKDERNCLREFKHHLALTQALAKSHAELEVQAAATLDEARQEKQLLASWMSRLLEGPASVAAEPQWERTAVVERNTSTGELRAVSPAP